MTGSPLPMSDAISFRQLRLFESVGRLNSARRGSEECNLSQPAVTQALGKLEQLMGTRLFDRRTSGSYLTEAGEILYRRVVRMFDQFSSALLDLDVPGGKSGVDIVVHRLTRSQVRSLLAIIQYSTYSSAAEMLGLTHASLQRAVRDLEANLRKPICLRTAAGVMVTSSGRELGRRMKLALQEIDWALDEIEVALGVGESQIIIGALPFGGSVLLASVLDEFLATHPKVDIRIINENASTMMRCLRAGEVDLVVGLTQETSGDDLVSQTLLETPYSVAARTGHPLLSKDEITIEDLTAHEWAIGAEASSRRQCFDQLFQSGERPRAPIITSSLPVIQQLLAGSDRLTLMTSYELMHEKALVNLPFSPALPCPAIGVTTRADWLPTQLHRDFIALLKKRVTRADLTENLSHLTQNFLHNLPGSV